MDNEPDPIAGTIIVVDIETSGLDPRRHAILQIGAGSVFRGPSMSVPMFRSDVRLREGADWDDGAERVHGIPQADAESIERPCERDALAELLRWLSQFEPAPVVLAGMNPAFDRDFLHAAAERCGLGRDLRRWIRHRTLDLHSVAVAYALAARIPVPPGGWATDEIYALVGQEPEARPHDAGEGVRREAAAFALLIHRLRWMDGRMV